MKKIILAVALCLATLPARAEIQGTFGALGGVAGSITNGVTSITGGKPGGVLIIGTTGLLSSSTQPANNLRYIGRNNVYGMAQNNNQSVTTSDQQVTTRITMTTLGPVSQTALLVGNIGNETPGAEGNGPNIITQDAAIEMPLGTTTVQFSLKGSAPWNLATNAGITLTDPAGIIIPAATNFAERFHTRVIVPPTSLAVAGSAAVGQLSVSTNYFYKITSVENGVESGPSAEATVATGANTSAALTWTAPLSIPNFVNIYRGTTTNTEVLVNTVSGNSTGWLDTNTTKVTSIATPPAALKFNYNRRIISGDSINNAGTADAVTGTGALTNAGPAGVKGTVALAVLGDDYNNPAVCGIGDSIMAGLGLIEVVSTTQTYQIGNWFDQGIIAVPHNSLNLGIPTSRAMWIAGNTTLARQRMALMSYCQEVVDQLGINDIENGQTWQQTALNNLAIGQSVVNRGGTFYLTTLLPQSASSSDDYTTVGGQTQTSAEAVRQNYNTWIRNGAQMSSGTPVLTGGTPSPIVSGYIDNPANVEVNSSNVLTANGGYWLAPAASFTGQVLTGSPTTTALSVSGTPYTANALIGYVVKITSGAANGQFATVISNTTSALTLAANGSAHPTGIGNYVGLTTGPSAADTFSLYPVSTMDGVHPSYVAHTLIASTFVTWLGTH